MCRQFFAAVAAEFALSCLMLLSNCRSCIQSALFSYRVILSFCCCYFVAVFRHFICVNIN